MAEFEERPGAQFGAYRLIEPLGEGGFGVVWRAEQSGALRREVALKILKLGMDTRQVIARFEAERQALAIMSHPGIAAVYEAGATPSGRPYFAMELVEGSPVTTYCDEHRLTTRERIALFQQVCHAVQHAHERGVIHRDLKPSNVLVVDAPQGPRPKVIDFGIAKATAGRLVEHSALTELRQMLGTPDYMAPEQAQGSGVELDARADVYSLGVVLYELLSGERPFDLATVAAEDYAEMLRTIREVDPDRPSTRLARSSERSTQIASRRGVAPPELERSLRGDLDWIAMKALEKDRERRYPSAAALAEELQRYLDDRPVLATRPDAAYRVAKFVVRNRLLVAATSAVIVALSIGLGAAIYGLRAARRESRDAEFARQRAVEAEREQARLREHAELALERAVESAREAEDEASHRARLAEFLAEMLRGVGPIVAQGRDTALLRSILEGTLARLDLDAAPLHPQSQFRLLTVVGEVYQQLGDYEMAERLHRRALELALQHARNEPHYLGEAYNNVGLALFQQSRLDESAGAFDSAMREYARSNTPEDATRIVAPNLAGVWVQLGQFERAFEAYEQILELARLAASDDPNNLATQLSNYGVALRAVGEVKRSEECFSEALALLESQGESSPDTIRAMINVAAARRVLGDVDGAIELLERALPLVRRVQGEEHPEVATCLINLGSARFYKGQREPAEAHFVEALELRRKLFGDPHPELGRPYEWLAQCARARKDRELACELAQKALQALRVEFTDSHPEVVSIRAYLGRLLVEAGRGDHALTLLAENFEVARTLGIQAASYVQALEAYAFALEAGGRWGAAFELLCGAYERTADALSEADADRPARLQARANAVRALCTRWNEREPNERAATLVAEWTERAKSNP